MQLKEDRVDFDSWCLEVEQRSVVERLHDVERAMNDPLDIGESFHGRKCVMKAIMS